MYGIVCTAYTKWRRVQTSTQIVLHIVRTFGACIWFTNKSRIRQAKWLNKGCFVIDRERARDGESETQRRCTYMIHLATVARSNVKLHAYDLITWHAWTHYEIYHFHTRWLVSVWACAGALHFHACDMCAKDGELYSLFIKPTKMHESKIQTLISTIKCMACACVCSHSRSRRSITIRMKFDLRSVLFAL